MHIYCMLLYTVYLKHSLFLLKPNGLELWVCMRFQTVIYSCVSDSKMTSVISIVILSLEVSVCIVFTFFPRCGGRKTLFHHALYPGIFPSNCCDHSVMQFLHETVTT